MVTAWRQRVRLPAALVVAMVALCGTPSAHASFLHGETLDMVADYASWLVLVIAPVVGIAVFWIVHILPEKIAEKRHHPQAPAIQALCLLSLVFGGLLWPVAMLWAVTKPVLHKAAYGTDKHDPHAAPPDPPVDTPLPLDDELQRLRAQIDGFSTATPPTPAQVHDLRARLAALEVAAATQPTPTPTTST